MNPITPDTNFSKKPAQKIGVAIFSEANPFSHENNWACMYQEDPFSFNSVSDLPSQTLWITNLDLNSLYEANLSKNPKIAHDGYLRTRLMNIAQELGATNLPPDQQAYLFAHIIGPVMEMAAEEVGFVSYPNNALSAVVGQLHGIPDAPQGSTLRLVAERSSQTYTACQKDRLYEKAEHFTFWIPRYENAYELLQNPVPRSDELVAIPQHLLPSLGKNAATLVEWALEKKVPLFAQIHINSIEPDTGRLLSYGSGANHLQESARPLTSSGQESRKYEGRNMREWCALPELEVLATCADIEIRSLVRASNIDNPSIQLRDPESLRAGSISYAYGIVAENIWVGLTRRTAGDNKAARTLSAAWIQSLDRMRCLKIAQKLTAIGFEVTHYGYGRITVSCPQSIRQLIPAVAREHGLLYPASIDGIEPYKPRPHVRHEVLQSVLANKDYTNLIKINELAQKEMSILKKHQRLAAGA